MQARIRTAVTAVLIGATIHFAPASEAQEWRGPIVPAAEPFTLNSYDVIDVVLMIRRVGILQWWDGRSRPQIVAVRTVESVWTGFNPDAYEAHQNRYDVLINGRPADWDRLYIEYGNDMINLRLLYTYRNQQPPPDVPYRLRWR